MTNNDDRILEWRRWRRPEHWDVHQDFWVQESQS